MLAWTFRRDANTGRSLERAIRRSADGIPYLAPEIQLLYKSKAIRSKDQTDFDAVIGYLDQDARAWLWKSIARLDPNHAWLSKLWGSIRRGADRSLRLPTALQDAT